MRNRSRFGWIELIEGILLIILGIFSFIRPDSMLSGFVMFFGLVALCIGILDIIFYVRTEEHMGFAPTISLISGSLSVLAGLMLLVYPGAVKWAFASYLDKQRTLLLCHGSQYHRPLPWHFDAYSPSYRTDFAWLSDRN